MFGIIICLCSLTPVLSQELIESSVGPQRHFCLLDANTVFQIFQISTAYRGLLSFFKLQTTQVEQTEQDWWVYKHAQNKRIERNSSLMSINSNVSTEAN